MIECHLRYGIGSWCYSNSTIKNSIQKTCNQFISMIFKSNNKNLLELKMEENNIMSIEQLLFLNIGLTMFKIQTGSYPSTLANLIVQPTRTRITRSRNRLQSENSRIQLTKQALAYKGPRFWNEIPDFVKFSNGERTTYRTLNDFKKNLKSYINSIGIDETNRITNEIFH